MKLKDWVKKEGRTLAGVARAANIPLPYLYGYVEGARSLNIVYAKEIEKLTEGQCSVQELTEKPKKPRCKECGRILYGKKGSHCQRKAR